jgi:hypothetical protein
VISPVLNTGSWGLFASSPGGTTEESDVAVLLIQSSVGTDLRVGNPRALYPSSEP